MASQAARLADFDLPQQVKPGWVGPRQPFIRLVLKSGEGTQAVRALVRALGRQAVHQPPAVERTNGERS